MTDFGLGRPPHRRWPWAGLIEARFTNIDVIVLLGAVLITGIIGAVSGVALLG
jgi:hypothetical protein